MYLTTYLAGALYRAVPGTAKRASAAALMLLATRIISHAIRSHAAARSIIGQTTASRRYYAIVLIRELGYETRLHSRVNVNISYARELSRM